MNHSPAQDAPDDAAPVAVATVLVIDDDRRFSEELVEMLAVAGFTAVTCLAAMDALVTARRVHPDVILLDINLGGVDGYQVMELLHRDEHLARVPVIAMSAYFERRPYDAIGKHYQIHSFISKPFQPLEMIAKIRQALAEPPRVAST